jgi:hypothetical protein
MNSQTPIVFIHRGNSWYLPYVLSQAKFSNPTSNITLIGDDLALQAVQGIKGIHSESLDKLESDSINSFRQKYSHMSSNSEEFELFCWLRWFYLLEYMRRHHIETAFHCDSDVLLYNSIGNIKERYNLKKNSACGFLIQKQSFDSFYWCASAHVSYWSNDLLKEFCEFSINSFAKSKFLDLYKEKFNYHLTEKKPGGICDMTTLYLFWKWNEDRIENLAVNHNANVIDNNINTGSNYDSDEYAVELNRGIKKVKFIRGCPFFFASDNSGTLVRVHALHFQGGAKLYIKEFLTYMPFLRSFFKLIHYLKSLKNKVLFLVKKVIGNLSKVVVVEKS